MIYLLKLFFVTSLLTSLVNSHGRVLSPKTRSEGQPNVDTQWCGFMHNQYYYNGINIMKFFYLIRFLNKVCFF